MKKICPSYVLLLKITKYLKCSKCVKYETRKIYIKDIFIQNKENQFSIAERVEERMIKKKKENRGLPGLPPSPGSKALLE